jgi:hypothetical protein
MKYRIKVIKLNDGYQYYIPQVKTSKLFSKWENILYDTYYEKLDGTSTTITYKYDEEIYAEIAIDMHKKKQQEQYNKRIKKITYRYY